MNDAHASGEHAQRELEVRVQALFQQGWIAVVGLPVVIACLVAAMWRFVPATTLLGWMIVTLASVALRVPVLRAYRSDARRDAHAARWARRYTLAVIAHGLCWAVAPWLFLDPAQSFAVTAYVMIAALMPTTSIPTQSNYPPAVYWIVSLTVLPMILRLAAFADTRYLMLAATLVFYFVFLIIFARLQHKLLGAGIRLRLENATLITALEAQRDSAEAQRARADAANRAKSQFLAAASHDLRQPLHALGLLCASLRELAEEPGKREVVENMFGAIDALESTFSELLDLSRMDAGYVRPKLQDFRLAEVFDTVRSYHAAAAAGKGLTLRMQGSDAIVHSDRALLERVLSNLLSNAVRYTDAGEVRLSAVRAGDGTLEIEVSDTGIGIAPDAQQRVFDEFVQLHNPERDRRRGLGLGLSIVRRICALLCHPLVLHSVPGRGTRVLVRVPPGSAEALRSTTPPPAPVHDVLFGRRVLLVEDDAGVRSATADLLRRWGCEVGAAEGAAQALADLHGACPDLVIADLRLREGTDGASEIDSVRARCARPVPALIVTGDTGAETLQAVRARGFAVLHKPVRAAQLRAAMSQLLTQETFADAAGNLPAPDAPPIPPCA